MIWRSATRPRVETSPSGRSRGAKEAGEGGAERTAKVFVILLSLLFVLYALSFYLGKRHEYGGNEESGEALTEAGATEGARHWQGQPHHAPGVDASGDALDLDPVHDVAPSDSAEAAGAGAGALRGSLDNDSGGGDDDVVDEYDSRGERVSGGASLSGGALGSGLFSGGESGSSSGVGSGVQAAIDMLDSVTAIDMLDSVIEETESLNQASDIDSLSQLVSADSPAGADESAEEAAGKAGAEGLFSAASTGVPGVSLVDGRLSNAYRWARRDPVRTRLDLPRVFPRDVRVWQRTARSKKRVCVFTRTPRQDSLWRTNLLSIFGSGQYFYDVMRATQCQHDGTCSGPRQARFHPSCSERFPRVMLKERIKNFEHERFAQVLTQGLESYDVFVATGDEFCRATNTFGRAHFRTYAGPLVVNASLRAPIYLPLGPREEFERIAPIEVKLVRERRYVFNFLGSLTSPSRRVLIKELRAARAHKSFLHIVREWAKKLTRANGYVPPQQYQTVLRDSVFTLCPQGHNPEAYRIFEAAEAGSIPILVLDHFYRQHECAGAFAPLIQQGAPFVFLNSWHELPAFLDAVAKDPPRQQRMQADVMAWYGAYMRKTALQFEQLMEARAADRLAAPDADLAPYPSTADLAALQAALPDAKLTEPLDAKHGMRRQ
jgi:hypothetical protein